jgi:hypothetical protein
MRIVVIALALLMVVGVAAAQTETFTPTPTATATATASPAPWVEVTIVPPGGTPPGQVVRYEYTLSAGETHIANLLTWLLFSLWGMFLYTVIFKAKK